MPPQQQAEDSTKSIDQATIDVQNSEFWNELCGSGLAHSLGIKEPTPENLASFDEAYLNIYPYLTNYLDCMQLEGRKVLEVGLGYGTLGQVLASKGCLYHGLDIALGPVEMLRYRLALLGQEPGDQVKQGSALGIPYESETFDYVYSIGCLHHTGDLEKCISEVYRVLAPGGKAVVMLYNRRSFRQLVVVPLGRLWYLLGLSDAAKRHDSFGERVRALYDTNSEGIAAPHTDYVSKKEVRRLFRRFSSTEIEVQNFDSYVFFKGKLIILRERLLNNIARILGLDLYIVSTK